MENFLNNFWPYLALAAGFGVAGVLQEAPENLLGDNKKTKEEELNRNIKPLLVTVKEEVEQIGNLTTVNMSLHRQVQELETKLKQTRDQCEEETEEHLRSVLQFGKKELERQALEDKISYLQEQKNLLERQMADKERYNAQMEENLLQIKEENEQLKKSASEMRQIHSGMNHKVMSLTAHLAAANCQIAQRENVVGQIQKNLCQVTEEKMKMEKQIHSQTETINRYKIETEELLIKVQDLQKEVRLLFQDKQSLECQLKQKSATLKDHKALLHQRDVRLQEMAKKANAIDADNNQLQEQLRQLQREKEVLLRDLDDIKMQKKQQEDKNTRLQKLISVLMSWRDGVAIGLVETDKELVNTTP